jgi:hypothetical protein
MGYDTFINHNVITIIMKCGYCDYQWQPRKQKPISCPRCKHRFDYPGEIKRIEKIKEE